MKIDFTHSGDLRKTEVHLRNLQKIDIAKIVRPQAERGVRALASATPLESGRASTAWNFEITGNKNVITIIWTNSDVENGFPVVIMLQYGYGTGTGGYVAGRDFINPAIRPIFDSIADEVWKAVRSA